MEEKENKNLGFNDAELEEIMDEIDSLEAEVNLDVEENQNNMEKTLLNVNNIASEGNNHTENVENSFVQVGESVSVHPQQEAPVVQLTSNNAAHPCQSAMNFDVKGDMSINMSFSVDGTNISVNVDAKEGLIIGFDNGVKFSYPLGNKKAV